MLSTTKAPSKQSKIVPFNPTSSKGIASRSAAQLSTITMAELYDNVYYSRPPVIDDLLYSGTYIFAGAPKMGKSFFAAQLAYHVSTGKPLWEHTVHPGTVLYLALEDNHQRLQQRMYRMFGMEDTDKLHFAVEASDLETGLLNKLETFIKEYPDTRLVIIDTLQKILAHSGRSNYERDYKVMGILKKFADEHGICLLLVHHTRKTKDKDPFNMISGSNGLMGCVDGAFVLRKDSRMEDVAELNVVGRDQPEQQIYLKRDMDTLVWDFENALKEEWVEPVDPVIEAVNEMLTAEEPAWIGSASELLQQLTLDMQPNALAKKLKINAGKLLNDYAIQYDNIHTRNGSRITLTRMPEATTA